MEFRRSLDGRAVALMTGLCALWGLQQVSLKAIAAEVPPAWMIGLRSGLAAVLLALLMWRRGEGLSPRSGRWKPGLLAGLFFGLEYVAVAQALTLTHASHVVVFLYTAPFFAALGLHWTLPAERLSPLQWGGIGLAFVGIAVAFGLRGAGAAAVPADWGRVLAGDLLALGAGAAWGATTVTIRCSSLSEAPSTETLMYQLLGATVLLLPGAWLTGQAQFSGSVAAWGHLLFQAVIVAFASFLAWVWLLRRYLASQLGVFSFLTPVFGVLAGLVWLGEALEPAFLAGTVLVVAGIVLVSGHATVAAWWARRRGAWRGVA